MKLFIFITLSAWSLVSARLELVDICEDGTYSHYIEHGPLILEPTCYTRHSKTVEDVIISDFSSCFCNPPTVRETVSNKCVTVDKCPIPDFQRWAMEHPELRSTTATPPKN